MMRTALPALLLAACLASAGQAQAPAEPVVTAEVTARSETAPVGTVDADAADDPAIWRDPRRPERSLIVATDKKAGLLVYGLDGVVRHFEPAGRVNNVDLVNMGRAGAIVVASDRNDEAAARLRVYRLDTRTGSLAALGAVDGGAGEGYGVCLMARGAAIDAYSVLKHGAVQHVRITLAGDAVRGEAIRQLHVATQAEGCVVDPRSRTLYVGEEGRGIWAFDARAEGSAEGSLVAAADGAQLVADVEGLALFPMGRRGGYLVASSQGDNVFAFYRLPAMTPAGRVRIVAGAVGAVEETDGIAIAPGSFGRALPGGLMVVQDGSNAPRAQNFKLVAWRDVLRALRRADRNR